MKKPELTATSVEKFLIEKFDSVSDLMQLSEGEESRAFSFDVGGRGYVLRVNSCADGFYKDRYVYRHFASAALPIPEVLDIGEFYIVEDRRIRGSPPGWSLARPFPGVVTCAFIEIRGGSSELSGGKEPLRTKAVCGP